MFLVHKLAQISALIVSTAGFERLHQRLCDLPLPTPLKGEILSLTTPGSDVCLNIRSEQRTDGETQ